MTDILNQIDAVLADVTSCQCGCGQAISERGPSPWFVNENHQARWDSRQVKGGIEEESVPAGPAPLLTLADVAVAGFEMRHRSLEDRRAYLAEQRARHVEMGAPDTWLGIFDALAAGQCPPVERLHPSLAEMNEASAAVRARRAPVDEQEGGQVGFDIGLRRINDGIVEALEAGHVRLPWICSRCLTELPWDLPGLRRLHEVNGCDPAAPPVDEHFREQLTTFCEENDETLARLIDQPVPWWRRMLGGPR